MEQKFFYWAVGGQKKFNESIGLAEIMVDSCQGKKNKGDILF